MGAVSKRKGNNRAARLRRRVARSVDQIFEDYHDSDTAQRLRHGQPVDVDKPGLGQFYCVECARYFVNAKALETHTRTKAHRRRVKLLNSEEPYTIEESERAAGLRRDKPPAAATARRETAPQ